LAARPIVLIDFNNISIETEWTRGGYLRRGIKQHVPPNGGHSIFKIEDKIFVFGNGTLLEEDLPTIRSVGINQQTSSIPRSLPDPTNLVERFSSYSSPVGFDYIQQTLETLSLLNSAQLSAHGIEDSELHTFTNNPLSSYTQSFSQYIKEKINPSSSVLYVFYKWATFFWVTIATLLLLYIFFASIVRSIKSARREVVLTHTV
jgi:hypothetical protein